MKARTVVVAAAVLAGATACVRLGLWQLGRWDERERALAAARAALAAPPVPHGAVFADPGSLAGRRVTLAGRFDADRHVVLTGRVRSGEPAVEVVTPLVLPGDSLAVPVLRGWLPAADAVTARPEEHPEPPGRAVTGVVEPLPRGPAGHAWRVRRAGALTVWSTYVLDADSLAAPGRFPYALAPYLVRELPGPGVPARPHRAAPPLPDAFLHLSYAVQWFAIAAVLLFGSLALAVVRRGAGRGR